MSKLTEAARGQECTIRLYPYCNGNSETTVFCHAPSASKGWARKSEDWWGAFGCSDCHDIIDGRRRVDDISDFEIFRLFMRGVHETINKQIEMGNIFQK